MPALTRTNSTSRSGFTLIELLIVVAIILILIAIALPNFLEAQIRARVTKARGEERTYATALEAYRLDFGGYPRDHDSIWPHPVAGNQNGFSQLTSPIKYLTSLPTDPFGEFVDTGAVESGGVFRNRALYYEGGSGSDETNLIYNFSVPSKPPCGTNPLAIYNNPLSRSWSSAGCIHAYLVLCIGPDHNDSTGENPLSLPGQGGNDQFPYDTGLNIYSPTNGTTSFGDIYKTVGEWRRGRVTRQAGSQYVPYNGEGE